MMTNFYIIHLDVCNNDLVVNSILGLFKIIVNKLSGASYIILDHIQLFGIDNS